MTDVAHEIRICPDCTGAGGDGFGGACYLCDGQGAVIPARHTRPASTEPADALVAVIKNARDYLLTVGNDYPGSSCQKWCAEKACEVWNSLEPWKHCPSTHCERTKECRSVNECSANSLGGTRTDALAEAREAKTHVEWRVHSGSGHNPPRVFTSESEAFEHARTEAVVPSYIREGAFRNAQVVKVTQTFEVTDLNGAALSRLNAQGEVK